MFKTGEVSETKKEIFKHKPRRQKASYWEKWILLGKQQVLEVTGKKCPRADEWIKKL